MKLSFFHDMNLNGRQDADEVSLKALKISSDGYYEISDDGSVLIPQRATAKLQVSGSAPNGKKLLSATFREPNSVILLPQFTYEVGTQDTLIGLADGFCTAPLKPDELNWAQYNDWLAHPDKFTNHIKEFKLYPPYAPEADAEPNWFFYGYYVPGPRHLALDYWAPEGVEVHAPVPGKIVKGNYDHVVGIQGPFGKLDLNHFHPSVQYGDVVKRGDVIGTLDANWHVHMELYTPHNARTGNPLILSCFPDLSPNDILVSPVKGQPVTVLPYFGP